MMAPFGKVRIVGIEGRAASVEQHQGGDVAGNGMVGEEAPHQIVAVADARRHHIVGGQQQPRILHRARRQHGDSAASR